MKEEQLQLTKESIAAEGIEIKITQADVIDALVDEQMEVVMSKFKELKKNYVSIEDKIKKAQDEPRNKAIAEIEKKLPKYITVEKGFFGTYGYGAKPGTGKRMVILEIRASVYGPANSNTTEFSLREAWSSGLNGHVIQQIPVKVHVKDVDIQTSFVKVEFHYKIPAALLKEIDEHNAKCNQFIKDYPEPISPSKISKQIKNKFTKEILKGSSTDFKKKLKLGFGMDL
jgi:hypothetical protein